jgi:hypothetical protein
MGSEQGGRKARCSRNNVHRRGLTELALGQIKCSASELRSRALWSCNPQRASIRRSFKGSLKRIVEKDLNPSRWPKRFPLESICPFVGKMTSSD